MVTGIILLAIALIICLAFMGITVWMYLNLERDFQKQKQALAAFGTQFDLFCADLTEQHSKAKELNDSTVDLVSKATLAVKEANEASGFALSTIQEIRKMLRLKKQTGQQVIYVHGKPAEIRSTSQDLKDFKFEEKEDDEEEPRS